MNRRKLGLGLGWVLVGSLNGLMGVIAGAFGAHYLATRVDARMLRAFETGAAYQMYHAVVLLAVGALMMLRPRRLTATSGYCMLGGVVLFSGSLYVLSLTGWRWVGPVTPLGGLLLMVGWLLLGVSAWRSRSAEETAEAS